MSVRRRAVVDHDLCQAVGYCVRIAPALFQAAGPEQRAVVIGELDTSAAEELAEEAELTCPMSAIELETIE